MAYLNDSSAVRGRGAQEITKRLEFNADLVTNSIDYVLLSKLWVPGVDYTRNGYFYVIAQVSLQASAAVIVTAYISIGNSRVAGQSVGNASVNRPSSTTITARSPGLFMSDGSQDIQLHICVEPAPGPGSATLNAVSQPTRMSAYMDMTYIDDPTVVSA